MSDNGNGYRVLVIRGMGGYLEDETYRLSYGQKVTIGRSRHCTFSLKDARKFVEGGDASATDEAFLRVSRNHLEISYPHPRMVEVRNLSRNGTRVDGKAIERVVLSELGNGTMVRFGPEEELQLSWEDVTDDQD